MHVLRPLTPCMTHPRTAHPPSGLDDPTVYDDDVVVHTSDQDCFPYYRKMGTLQDSKLMVGNCAVAQPGFGRNEMCVWHPPLHHAIVLPVSLSAQQSWDGSEGEGVREGQRIGASERERGRVSDRARGGEREREREGER